MNLLFMRPNGLTSPLKDGILSWFNYPILNVSHVEWKSGIWSIGCTSQILNLQIFWGLPRYVGTTGNQIRSTCMTGENINHYITCCYAHHIPIWLALTIQLWAPKKHSALPPSNSLSAFQSGHLPTYHSQWLPITVNFSPFYGNVLGLTCNEHISSGMCASNLRPALPAFNFSVSLPIKLSAPVSSLAAQTSNSTHLALAITASSKELKPHDPWWAVSKFLSWSSVWPERKSSLMKDRTSFMNFSGSPMNMNTKQ